MSPLDRATTDAVLARAREDMDFRRGLADLLALPAETLVSAHVIAHLLDIPATTVRQYARQGRLPCLRIGQYVKFRPSDVIDAVDRASAAGMAL